MKIPQPGTKILYYFIRLNIAALVIGAAILLSACENNLGEIRAFSSTENLPVVEAENFETMFTDSGKISFYLKTPKLLRFEIDRDVYVEFPEGIELLKIDNNNDTVSSITADYAKQFVEEEKWEAKNNVVATNANGDTLKTDYLIWDEKKEKIYTEEFVHIVGPDKDLTGMGFEADQSMNNWKIMNPRGPMYFEIENENNSTADTLNEPTGREPQPFSEPLEFGN